MKICTFLHFLANLPLCFMSPLTTILTFHKQVWWEESRYGFHKPVDYHTAPDRDVANEQQDIYLMCYRWFHVKFLLPSMKSTWLVCGQLTPESAVNSQGKYNSITQSPFSISPPPMSPLPSPPPTIPYPTILWTQSMNMEVECCNFVSKLRYMYWKIIIIIAVSWLTRKKITTSS